MTESFVEKLNTWPALDTSFVLLGEMAFLSLFFIINTEIQMHSSNASGLHPHLILTVTQMDSHYIQSLFDKRQLTMCKLPSRRSSQTTSQTIKFPLFWASQSLELFLWKAVFLSAESTSAATVAA